MAQDLLAAIGSRLEAQLKARDARLKSVEDTVKAQVSMNPPAAFSLLPDGTKQFGYAPRVDSPLSTSILDESTAGAAAQTEDISDPGASFAALISAAAQIFTEAAAEPQAVPADSAAQEIAIMPTTQNPVTLATTSAEADAPMVAQMLTPTIAVTTAAKAEPATPVPVSTAAAAAVATEAPTAAAATTTSTTTTTAAAIAATSAAIASAIAAAAAAGSTGAAARSSTGFVMLADGTKQFGYAPTGNTMGALASISKTPPVPADFGAGATMRRKGVGTDTPMTVTRVGDGVVFANFTDSEGTREMAFYPNQMDLVTAAP